MGTFSTNMPWVIFHLLNEQFAVSANCIREMIAMPKVVPIPQSPNYIRGVINLRGQVMLVMDLRLRMGMTSFVDETKDLIALLDQREKDHKNWIEELESSVRERRAFNLATNPHKCAFGKWYDNFKTENRILAGCLKKFDAPHRTIHAIASKVKEMEEKEDFEAAYDIIHRTREGELAEMIRLFLEARTLLRESTREIAMVLECDQMVMAVGVDSVEAVEKLSESNVEDMPEAICTLDNECIAGIAKREQDDNLVQLLDVGELIGQEKDLALEDQKIKQPYDDANKNPIGRSESEKVIDHR